MNAQVGSMTRQTPRQQIAAADFVGEAIDQLITIEAKNPGLPHNVLAPMYQAARTRAGGRPLSMVCAERLQAAVGAGDTVLMLTGAGYAPQMPQGEDDGPPGVASLARMLYKGLGAVPVYVAEACHVDPIVASSHAAGLMVREFRHARDGHLGAALSVAPKRQAEVAAWIADLFETMQPKAVVSAERLGPGGNGLLHNLTAQPYMGPDTTTEYDVVDISGIVTEAGRRGILSIGIGDHGNEIGFGSIIDTVAECMPNGRTLCTVVATDLLLPAMMSNWGCYGIEAALAFLLGSPQLIHSPDQEARIIRACQKAGGIDAIHTSTEFGVDGLDGETSMACMQLLGSIVRKSLEKPNVGHAH